MPPLLYQSPPDVPGWVAGVRVEVIVAVPLHADAVPALAVALVGAEVNPDPAAVTVTFGVKVMVMLLPLAVAGRLRTTVLPLGEEATMVPFGIPVPETNIPWVIPLIEDTDVRLALFCVVVAVGVTAASELVPVRAMVPVAFVVLLIVSTHVCPADPVAVIPLR